MNREFQYDKVTNMLKIMNQQKALMEGQKEVTDCAYRSESDDVIREHLESITKVFGKGIEETGRDYDGFQGAYESIMEEDKRSSQLLDESYGRWNTLYTRLKTLNGTLKTGISFGSAGYGEEGREFRVEEFLAEMEKAHILNLEIKEELIQEKYEEYKKAEKWKEVMKEENLSRIELLALARVGRGLEEAQFSGEGGFMELAETLGFDKIANVDPELYTRMYESLMTLDWEGIYEKKELSQIECMVMAQKVMEFTGPEEWNKFAEMSIEKGFLGRYYMNPNLQGILDAGKVQFGSLQYEVMFGKLDKDKMAMWENKMNSWGENLAILNFLESKEVDLSALNKQCWSNGKPVGVGDIFHFYIGDNKLYLDMLRHGKNEYAEDKKVNCRPGEEYNNWDLPHDVKTICMITGDVTTFDTAFTDSLKKKIGDLKNGNMIDGLFIVQTGADGVMVFMPPQVGLPYAAGSKLLGMAEKAENRKKLDEMKALVDMGMMTTHFPNSIHASYLAGSDSDMNIWFDSDLSTDLKNIENHMNSLNGTICGINPNVDSPAFVDALKFLNEENDYFELESTGKVDSQGNELKTVSIKPGAMEALKQNMNGSVGEVSQFLSTLNTLRSMQ